MVKRFIMLILSMLCLMQINAYQLTRQYISDVKVCGSSLSEPYANGFQAINRNTNDGTSHGYYTIVSYKYTTDPSKAITDIMIMNGKQFANKKYLTTPYVYNGKNYYLAPYNSAADLGDLNNGAGGDYLFVFYSRDYSPKRLTSMGWCNYGQRGDHSYMYTYNGSKKVVFANVNQGTDGYWFTLWADYECVHPSADANGYCTVCNEWACIFHTFNDDDYTECTNCHRNFLFSKGDGYFAKDREPFVDAKIVDFNCNYVNNAGLYFYELGNAPTTLRPRALQSFKFNELQIPKTVTSIGDSAFYGSQIVSYTIDKSLIPNYITHIGDYAFANCSNLSGTLTIPQTMSKLGSHIFYNCPSITGTLTLPSTLKETGDATFAKCSGITELKFPSTAITMGDSAFAGMSGLTKLTIPSWMTTIGQYAFDGCSGLTSLKIPSTVKKIGYYAFANCTGLTTITFPSTPIEYGSSLFEGCTSLTKITIPSWMTEIKHSTFEGCTGLTSVTIPKTVTSISSNAFRDCTGLKNIYIPSSVTSFSYFTFAGCTSLQSITIPSSVTEISYALFRNCTSLQSVTIPNTILSIQDNAFEGCFSLSNVTIPKSVNTICYHAFGGCLNLRTIICKSETPSSLGSSVFKGLPSDFSIYVPAKSVETYKNADGWKEYKDHIKSIADLPKLKGDVNGDGIVSISDIPSLIKILLGKATDTKGTADVNGDGKINISDITSLVSLTLQKE